MALELVSAAFTANGEIPRDYTGDGKDEVPPLEVRGVPRKTKTLALIVEDPDAPGKLPFVHWLVWDIPATAQQLGPELPGHAVQGKNDFGRVGYAGPKPPSGRHRYVFKLYALDTTLAERKLLTRKELEKRIEGHVLDHAELIGTYARAA